MCWTTRAFYWEGEVAVEKEGERERERERAVEKEGGRERGSGREGGREEEGYILVKTRSLITRDLFL